MIHITTEQMREMIGLKVRYHACFCQVIEILEDGPCIVLKDLEAQTSIQADQHGEARRRVPITYTVMILSDDRTEFSADFLALEPLSY